MNEPIKVLDIYEYLKGEIPLEMQEEWDNSGLLVGLTRRPVTKIHIALDITDVVIAEAIQSGAELIISHHPLFFSCKNVLDTDTTGRKIIALLENGISAICMHTNLDASPWGVNVAFAERLGLANLRLLEEEGIGPDGKPYGIPRVGELGQPMAFADFLGTVKTALDANGLRYTGGEPVRKVAICGGSGGDFLQAAMDDGCDTLVTSDIKYHVFLEAKERGFNLIDADHFATENVICPVLRQRLAARYPGVEVSVSSGHEQTALFY